MSGTGVFGFDDPAEMYVECGWKFCRAKPEAELGICLHHAIKAYMWVRERGGEALNPKPARTEPVRIVEPSIVEKARRARLASLPSEQLTEQGYVYCIRFADRVKIGFSTNPKKRLTALPHDEILGLMPGTRVDEAELHVKFMDYRHSGEWFYDNPAIREFVDNHMQRPGAA